MNFYSFSWRIHRSNAVIYVNTIANTPLSFNTVGSVCCRCVLPSFLKDTRVGAAEVATEAGELRLLSLSLSLPSFGNCQIQTPTSLSHFPSSYLLRYAAFKISISPLFFFFPCVSAPLSSSLCGWWCRGPGRLCLQIHLTHKVEEAN